MTGLWERLVDLRAKRRWNRWCRRIIRGQKAARVLEERKKARR